MSPATAPAAIGAILSTVDELEALPLRTILLGDPDALHSYDDNRQLALQKRADACSCLGECTGGETPYWYPAWDTDIFNAIASEEAVYRFHLGPFQVLWLPPSN